MVPPSSVMTTLCSSDATSGLWRRIFSKRYISICHPPFSFARRCRTLQHGYCFTHYGYCFTHYQEKPSRRLMPQDGPLTCFNGGCIWAQIPSLSQSPRGKSIMDAVGEKRVWEVGVDYEQRSVGRE